jgi:hypothetical protein
MRKYKTSVIFMSFDAMVPVNTDHLMHYTIAKLQKPVNINRFLRYECDWSFLAIRLLN